MPGVQAVLDAAADPASAFDRVDEASDAYGGRIGSVARQLTVEAMSRDAAAVLAAVSAQLDALEGVPEEMKDAVAATAATLKVSTRVLAESAGKGTKRGDMAALGGAAYLRRALASRDARDRRNARAENPLREESGALGNGSNQEDNLEEEGGRARTPFAPLAVNRMVGAMAALPERVGIAVKNGDVVPVGLRKTTMAATKVARVGRAHLQFSAVPNPPLLSPRSAPMCLRQAKGKGTGKKKAVPKYPKPKTEVEDKDGRLRPWWAAPPDATSLPSAPSHRWGAPPASPHCSYTSEELAQIAAQHRKTRGNLQRVHADMLDKGYGNVCSYKHLCTLGKRQEKGEAVRPTGAVGRPPHIDADELEEELMRRAEDPSFTFGRREIADLIRARGLSVSRSTVDLYLAKAALMPGFQEQVNVGTQTTTRWVAARSPRAALSYLIWLSKLYFAVGVEYLDKGLTRVDSGAEETALGVLISDANSGAPVHALPPESIFNHDETSVYAVQRSDDPNDLRWEASGARLGRPERPTRGTTSKKGTAGGGDGMDLSGIRVSVATLVSGMGLLAPLVVTVSGLSERQLDEPMVRFRLPELDDALIILVRGKLEDGEATAKVAAWGRVDEEVWRPFMTKHRSKSTPRCVHMFDGAGEGLRAYADADVLAACDLLGIVRGKHHASETGIRQVRSRRPSPRRRLAEPRHRRRLPALPNPAATPPAAPPHPPARVAVLTFAPAPPQVCDLMAAYRSLKASEKTRGGPATVLAHQVKAAILKALHEHHSVRLGSKAAPLADFVASLGDRIPTICSAKEITAGFLRAGQFVSVAQPFPSVESAINTMLPGHKGMAKETVLDLARNPDVFKRLYLDSEIAGLIPEATFEALGVPEDELPSGETYVRAKGRLDPSEVPVGTRHLLLTGPGFREALKKNQEAAEAAFAVKAAKVAVKINAILDDARTVEESIALVAHPAEPGDWTLDHITAALEGVKAKRALLQHFVHARIGSTAHFPGPAPKLGKAADAATGERNLWWHAHNVCNRPVVLVAPSTQLPAPPPPPEPFRDGGAVLVTAGSAVAVHSPPPSTFLALDGPRQGMFAAAVVETMPLVHVVNPFLSAERADAAHATAIRRLRAHVARVEGGGRSDMGYWVWRWAAEALGRAVAVFEAAGWLVLDDWKLLADGDSWLERPGTTDAVPDEPTVEFEDLVGAYAYSHPNKGVVRVGMTCGVGSHPLLRRRREHADGAALTRPSSSDSLFYCSYPTVEAFEAGRAPAGRRGTHEALAMSVVFGIHRDDPGAWIDDGPDGFLPWPAYFEVGLRGVMAGTPHRTKRLRAVAYLFELAGELLLDREQNVSVSPGFEQLIRSWKQDPAGPPTPWPAPADEAGGA